MLGVAMRLPRRSGLPTVRLTPAKVAHPHSNRLFAMSGKPLGGLPMDPMVMKETALAIL
jgi:hypothetical protein